MASTVRPLGTIFANWPVDVADTLGELVTYDYGTLNEVLSERGVDDELRELILELRGHAVDIKNAADRETPLSGPEAVAEALGVTLSPPLNRWITYPLDASRRRIAAPHKTSGARFVCTITAKVPRPDELPAIPEGGCYLLVRRVDNGTQVLEIDGVVERLDYLARHVALADVVLYERSTDGVTPSTVYSLRRGVGARGRSSVTLQLADDTQQKVSRLWK